MDSFPLNGMEGDRKKGKSRKDALTRRGLTEKRSAGSYEPWGTKRRSINSGPKEGRGKKGRTRKIWKGGTGDKVGVTQRRESRCRGEAVANLCILRGENRGHTHRQGRVFAGGRRTQNEEGKKGWKVGLKAASKDTDSENVVGSVF